MRRLLALMLLFALASTPALGTPATELAAQAGISTEQAERDITAQEGAPGIVERLEGALGADYAGAWFNNKTGKFVVPLVSAASKPSARAVVGSAGGSYPSAARTYAQLEAKRDSLTAELPNAAVYIDPKANAVRVRFASSMTAAQKSSVKAKAEPGVIVQSAPPSLVSPQAMACTFPFCMEPEGAPSYEQHGVVRGGVRIGFGYNAYCTAGFIVRGYDTDYMLTAGHCNWYLGTWEPPTLNAYKPQQSNPSPCLMHNVRFNMDEAGGDNGLAALDGCDYSPTLEVWHVHAESEPPEELAVYAKPKTIFNCPVDRPSCNDPIPADARAYVGQWACHSGATTETQCGEVWFTDATVTGAYPEGRLIPEHHLTYICALVEGGDSGGPMFSRVANHAVGSGIVTLGSHPGCGVYAAELWWIKQQLGVHLP